MLVASPQPHGVLLMPTVDDLMVHCGVSEFSERFYSFDSYPWKDEHADRMKRWAESPNGSVLITGEPGVGKSGLAIAAMKERFRRGDNVWFEGEGKSILKDPYRTKKLKFDLVVLDDIIQYWRREKEDGLLELLKTQMRFIITTPQWKELSGRVFGISLKSEIERFEHIVLERGES